MSLRRLAVLAPLVLAASARAYYGPPFITDDPQPVDFRHWEVYFASIDFHEFGYYSGFLPHFEVNYGAAPNLQLHVIAPLAYDQSPGQPFFYGYGDTELGAKYRFVQESKNTPMVGIFPLLEVPTGNVQTGLGEGKASEFFPVWLQKSRGNLTVYGGGGFWNQPGLGLHDYWFGGVTAQYQATKPLMVGLELFHTSSQVIGTGEITGFNIGAVYDFNDGHHLMFSIGTGFQGPDHGTAYIAYQLTFGPREKAGPDSGKSAMMFGRGIRAL